MPCKAAWTHLTINHQQFLALHIHKKRSAMYHAFLNSFTSVKSWILPCFTIQSGGFPPLISLSPHGTFTASMAGDLGAAAAQSTGESLLKMPTLAGAKGSIQGNCFWTSSDQWPNFGQLGGLVEVEDQF